MSLARFTSDSLSTAIERVLDEAAFYYGSLSDEAVKRLEEALQNLPTRGGQSARENHIALHCLALGTALADIEHEQVGDAIERMLNP